MSSFLFFSFVYLSVPLSVLSVCQFLSLLNHFHHYFDYIAAPNAPIITSVQLLLHFPTQSRLLTTLKNEPFENLVEKGENAGNQHFLLFPQCFLPFPKQISIFSVIFILSTANAFNCDQSIILSFELTSTARRDPPERNLFGFRLEPETPGCRVLYATDNANGFCAVYHSCI